MDLQADAVPESMDEGLAPARLGDEVAGRGIAWIATCQSAGWPTTKVRVMSAW